MLHKHTPIVSHTLILLPPPPLRSAPSLCSLTHREREHASGDPWYKRNVSTSSVCITLINESVAAHLSRTRWCTHTDTHINTGTWTGGAVTVIKTAPCFVCGSLTRSPRLKLQCGDFTWRRHRCRRCKMKVPVPSKRSIVPF